MKKALFVFLLLSFVFTGLTAQESSLILRKNENQFYIEHAVSRGENYYSIGRRYNVPAKDVAAYNKLNMDKGLNIDQKIRIPLSEANFTQTGNSGAAVYYRAGLNTTLTRISEAYRNVGVERLKYWNRRDKEEVSEGEKLIIGFMTGTTMPVVTIDYKIEKPEPVTVALNDNEDISVEPEEETEEVAVSNGNPPPVVTEGNKKEEQGANENREEGSGYFRAAFDKQVKTQPLSTKATVTSGIFKTASGWEDAKYYLLVDNVPPGTIVKLENPGTMKVIYAKVLGGMSGIRLNESFDIRVSNAAASILQVSDTEKFILQMSY